MTCVRPEIGPIETNVKHIKRQYEFNENITDNFMLNVMFNDRWMVYNLKIDRYIDIKIDQSILAQIFLISLNFLIPF